MNPLVTAAVWREILNTSNKSHHRGLYSLFVTYFNKPNMFYVVENITDEMPDYDLAAYKIIDRYKLTMPDCLDAIITTEEMRESNIEYFLWWCGECDKYANIKTDPSLQLMHDLMMILVNVLRRVVKKYHTIE